MRSRELSLAQAAKQAGTTPRTMQRHVGKALKKRDDGRFAATKWDRIPRTMKFLTENGLTHLVFNDSREASEVARYWNAIERFLLTGDQKQLASFRGKTVRSGKTAHAFMTNTRTLERLGYAGELAYEDIYQQSIGESK